MRTTDVALSGVTATVRTWSSGVRVTSWIESTAPSDETQRRGRRRSRCGVPRVLDRRDRRDVELAGEQHPVELGRDAVTSSTSASAGGRPAPCSRTRCGRAGSRVDPAVERDEVAVEVERRELARAEVGVVDAVARDGVQDVGRAQLGVELVDPLDLDPAAGRAGEERLGPVQTGRSSDVLARAPALVAGLPEVERSRRRAASTAKPPSWCSVSKPSRSL